MIRTLFIPRLRLESLESRDVPSLVPVGPEFQVNTLTDGNQVLQSVAMDSAGEFVIAWRSGGFSTADIVAQRFDTTGMALGSEFRVNTNTAGSQNSPCVAMDADGDFVVAWSDYSGQDGSGSGVFAQRYNAAGIPQGAEFRVNSFTTNDQYGVDVAMAAGGEFVIAWYSNGQLDGFDVYAQRYSVAGVAEGDEFLVNSFTSGGQLSPSVAIDASGAFVISWQDYEQDGSRDGIYAQRYNSGGLAQGGEFLVNSYTTGRQFLHAMSMNAAGDFVSAWTDGGSGGGRRPRR